MRHSLTSLPVPGAQGGKIEAPGHLLSHYAPSQPLRLNAASARADEFLIGIGVMDCDLNLSESGHLQQAPARLFDGLPQADASAARAISLPSMPPQVLRATIKARHKRTTG